MTQSPDSQSPAVIEATQENFQQEVIERSRELPVVVDFWAEWCGPCRMLGPALEKLAAEFAGRVQLVKANTEELPGIAAGFGVQSIPAVFALRDGKIVDQFVGVLAEPELRTFFERILPSKAEKLAAEAAAVESSDTEAAEAKYRAALADNADLPAATIGLARLLLARDELEESHALIEGLAARGYLEPEAEQLQGEINVRRQAQASGGVEAARMAVDESPNDGTLRLALAGALAAEGEYEEALEICLNLVQTDKARFGEPARKAMVDMFHALGADSELASAYRRKLSTALY